jgi:hypothetical protein
MSHHIMNWVPISLIMLAVLLVVVNAVKPKPSVYKRLNRAVKRERKVALQICNTQTYLAELKDARHNLQTNIRYLKNDLLNELPPTISDDIAS